MRSMQKLLRSVSRWMVVVLVVSIAGVGMGSFQPYTVCPSGCPYSSIQEAINDAFPGDTITVGPGAYKEHL